MSEPNKLVGAIFEAAIELPPERRTAYLQEACAGDYSLRQRVEALLRAHESAEAFMDHPAVDLRREQLAVQPAEQPGDRIGRYKLLQHIGEGGCGVVYMAEQEEPVHRRVALKVIKLGMDTRSVIARFEAERQALALMDHPNIAKVLDAGSTETGRPYFVMELVRGIKITDYCDQHSLSTERLGLFIQVCRAIQHAHQKGIIHRDIKPSNILVTIDDGVPLPKVIDFGIAKATHGKLTDQTLFTAFEQFIGTPAYMSPEQAELSAQDIDTRNDIYSLGVLLYELLTGKTPFDSTALLSAGLDELRRAIREIQPVRPSTQLSAMAKEELTTTAQRRGAEAPRLISLVTGDLDWIVMKCLEKDRARRYETANGLATDIERHLGNEPVLARPPSRLYEFQKTVRRHRVGFAAVAAVVVALSIGVVVSSLEAVRARQAERAQRRLREAAETAQAKEAEQRRRADDLQLSNSLAAWREEESAVLSRVIANHAHSALPQAVYERARACVARLSARVKSGEGSDSDHQLLARFLARGFSFNPRPIQTLDSPITLWFTAPGDLPVAGLGILLQPSVSVDGTSLQLRSFPHYHSGTGNDVTTSETLRLQPAVEGPGVWEFSILLNAQLVHEKSKGQNWDHANPADFRPVGSSVPIALPNLKRTFVTKLPPDYPTEILDDLEAKKIADGLAVSEGKLLREEEGRWGGEFSIKIPSPAHAFPVALRVDVVQFNGASLRGWFGIVRRDHVLFIVTQYQEPERFSATSIEASGQVLLKFTLPGIPSRQIQRSVELQIAIRSAQEVALHSDVDSFLKLPEVRKTVALTGAQ